MLEQLRETKNYSMFILDPMNRDVNKKSYSTKELERSMEKFGWIGAHPMHVIRAKEGKLLIVAGHHRFTVARTLNIPVKYVICEDQGVTIHDLEKGAKTWSTSDFLQSHYRAKNHNYIIAKNYMDETGIAPSLAFSLCAGGTSSIGKHMSHKVKDGSYEIGDMRHANTVKMIVLGLKKLGVEYATNKLLVEALAKLTRVKEFDPQIFLKRAAKNKGSFDRQATHAAYLHMIESIYNRHSGGANRLPLAFLATEATRTENSDQPPTKSNPHQTSIVRNYPQEQAAHIN